MNKESLIKIGGNAWEKNGHSRVYFGYDIIIAAMGLECTYYKSGNISSATLNGERISNRKAVGIRQTASHGKFYYDCNTDQFVSDIDTDYHDQVIKYITAEIAKLTPAPAVKAKPVKKLTAKEFVGNQLKYQVKEIATKNGYDGTEYGCEIDTGDFAESTIRKAIRANGYHVHAGISGLFAWVRTEEKEAIENAQNENIFDFYAKVFA